MVDRAPGLHLVGDQSVLAVQEQQAELLIGLMRHRGAQIVVKRA